MEFENEQTKLWWCVARFLEGNNWIWFENQISGGVKRDSWRAIVEFQPKKCNTPQKQELRSFVADLLSLQCEK